MDEGPLERRRWVLLHLTGILVTMTALFFFLGLAWWWSVRGWCPSVTRKMRLKEVAVAKEHAAAGDYDAAVRIMAKFVGSPEGEFGYDHEEATRQLIAFGPDVLDPIFRQIVERSGSPALVDAASAFGTRAAARARPLIEHEDEDVRRTAVLILARTGEPTDLDTVLRMVAEDESPEVRIAAVEALVREGDRRVLEASARMLASEDWHERHVALRAVRELMPDNAFDVFVHALDDPALRSSAIHGLGMTGDPRAAPILVQFAKAQDGNPRFDDHGSVVRALSRLPDSVALPAMLELGKYWGAKENSDDYPLNWVIGSIEDCADEEAARGALAELEPCVRGTRHEEFYAAARRRLSGDPPPPPVPKPWRPWRRYSRSYLMTVGAFAAFSGCWIGLLAGWVGYACRRRRESRSSTSPPPQ